MSMKYIFKPAITLLITAVITVALLSVVYNFTKEPIEKQKRRTQEEAMREVLPKASDYREMETELSGSIVAIYEGLYISEALTDDVLIGYVIMLSPEGYSGNIDIVVGIYLGEGKISGMRVLRHTETPGLGALAVKEDFYSRYEGLPFGQLTVVRSSPGENEIQAITSATITTRAITNAINEAIEWCNKWNSINEEEEGEE